MQKKIGLFKSTLVVLAIIGLLGTFLIPQNVMAQSCPSRIVRCTQCTCIGYRITPYDLYGAVRCIYLPNTLNCSRYDVTGASGVSFLDFRVLLNCYLCQQRTSPTA